MKGRYVKFAGGHFAPLVYIKNASINAVLDNSGESTALRAEGKVDVYSLANMDMNGFKYDGLAGGGGFDISVQAEYALLSILDVGLKADHIPLIPSATKEYSLAVNKDLFKVGDLLSGSMPDMDIAGILDFSKMTASGEIAYIMRPMRWDAYALFRPLRNNFLVLKPNMGFTAINSSEKGYFNIGLQADLNVGRWFTFSFFTGSYDGMARNRLLFDFHWAVLPRYLAIETRSQDYFKAWTLNGVSVTFGGALAF
jgi:hypothetical protein